MKVIQCTCIVRTHSRQADGSYLLTEHNFRTVVRVDQITYIQTTDVLDENIISLNSGHQLRVKGDYYDLFEVLRRVGAEFVIVHDKETSDLEYTKTLLASNLVGKEDLL